MSVIIVSKAPYSLRLPSGGFETISPLVLAGHTVQLVRPLASLLEKAGCPVGLVFPLGTAPDESYIIDPLDKVPQGVATFPYRVGAIPKSVHGMTTLSLNASILRAFNHLPSVQWVLFVNVFPFLPLAELALHHIRRQATTPPRTGILLRGGDAYKWANLSFLAAELHDSAEAEMVHRIYLDSLSRADFVGTSSEWLKTRTESQGISVDTVIPSPPVEPSSGTWQEDRTAVTSLGTLFGTLQLDRKWLVVSGRLHRDKRPELALEAFKHAELLGWSLIFAGAGDVGYLRNLWLQLSPDQREQVAAITVPPRLLPQLYGSADAFLHTSLPTSAFTDSRPSSVTSAASIGKPVVAVLGGGIAECLSPMNRLTLCVGEPTSSSTVYCAPALTERLRLLDQPQLRSAIGEANRRHALTDGSHDALRRLVESLELDIGPLAGNQTTTMRGFGS